MPASQKITRSLRETKVAVIHPQDEDGQSLSLQLRRIGCHLTTIWPPQRRMPPEVDAIFFLADPDQPTTLDWLEDDRSCALIAIIAYENPLILETISSTTIHGVIAKLIRTFGVLACLVTALSLYKYETTLISRIAKLDETLKTRRIVEKASRILASGRCITEDEAYGVLRREAMNKQITLYEMATSIINAGSLLTKGYLLRCMKGKNGIYLPICWFELAAPKQFLAIDPGHSIIFTVFLIEPKGRGGLY